MVSSWSTNWTTLTRSQKSQSSMNSAICCTDSILHNFLSNSCSASHLLPSDSFSMLVGKGWVQYQSVCWPFSPDECQKRLRSVVYSLAQESSEGGPVKKRWSHIWTCLFCTCSFKSDISFQLAERTCPSCSDSWVKMADNITKMTSKIRSPFDLRVEIFNVNDCYNGIHSSLLVVSKWQLTLQDDLKVFDRRLELFNANDCHMIISTTRLARLNLINLVIPRSTPPLCPTTV